MKNYWYVAATSDELTTKPLARQIDGEPVVLFRDAQGRAAALFDRCSHRNAQLSRGWTKQGCVVCPYHGWEFDSTGTCTRIPALAEGDRLPPKSHVPAFPVQEQQGYVWVFVGDGDPTVVSPYRLPELDAPGWGYARLETTIRNSVLNVVENFIDCPHTGYIHGGLFRNEPDHSVQTTVRTTEDGIAIEIDESAKASSLLGRLLLRPGEKVTHTDSFHMPSVVEVHYAFGSRREVRGFQICTPVSEYETRVYVHVAYRLGWLTAIARPIVKLAGRKVLAQDLWILENQGDMVRRFGENYCSSAADTANLWIRNYRMRAERGEGPENRAGLEIRVEFRL